MVKNFVCDRSLNFSFDDVLGPVLKPQQQQQQQDLLASKLLQQQQQYAPVTSYNSNSSR